MASKKKTTKKTAPRKRGRGRAAVGSDDTIREIEGTLAPTPGARFGIVASRFNAFVVEPLVAGAIDTLVRHGVRRGDIVLVRVPGSWETPHAVARLAESGRVDAVIALGAVIRGGTPHFEYVAGEVSKGIAAVSVATGVPVSFGVITTNDVAQAIERAGTKAGNKGADAAMAALEMVSLDRALDDAGF